MAELATANAPDDDAVTEMVINRFIDNAAVAVCALDRAPVSVARAQALAHTRPGGAAIFGVPNNIRVHCEWAAWANSAAVRELDFHDAIIIDTGCHPGDNIPSLLAVAQQSRRSGMDLVRAVAVAYEVQIALAKDIPISSFAFDHVGHLGPSIAAGLGKLLGLSSEVTYQALQHAGHVSLSTRQGRKGMLSSWKAFAPGHVGKLAIEAVDRAMRGESSPSPLYEGEYLGRLMGGPDVAYTIGLRDADEPRAAILESYTKEHSAGYHGQAPIDLAFKMGRQIKDFDSIEKIDIHTKERSHYVMGSGSNDPEKWDPNATRETLDHSMMFIFAVALQDGTFHHDKSYAPERKQRPDTVRLWKKIQTVFDPEWERRFKEPPSIDKDHGARVVITFKDGTQMVDEMAVANSHPRGAAPFKRPDYIKKFRTLTEGIITSEESERFLDLVQRLPELGAAEVDAINVQLDPKRLAAASQSVQGIF
ncbi:2-methylcitrate dehydratase [Terrihabitans soli]|uniref:2-methylcitrate dehydratase n=1 Tax=Terrihabitans soli TaxID=708113 RepID=A0A6S6QTG8_9HYPH|nr:2-methylcitrate dehydratase [Terrihabitans soli]